MTRARRFSRLRLSISLFWLGVCCLLVMLWLRSSFWQADIIIANVGNTHVRFDSGIGCLAIQFPNYNTRRFIWNDLKPRGLGGGHNWDLGFPRFWEQSSQVWGHFETSKYWRGLCVPYWFLLIISAMLAAITWIHPRFSLRTLLIATTLIALLLGLVMWSMR